MDQPGFLQPILLTLLPIQEELVGHRQKDSFMITTSHVRTAINNLHVFIFCLLRRSVCFCRDFKNNRHNSSRYLINYVILK